MHQIVETVDLITPFPSNPSPCFLDRILVAAFRTAIHRSRPEENVIHSRADETQRLRIYPPQLTAIRASFAYMCIMRFERVGVVASPYRALVK